MSKEVGTPRYLSLVVPLVKVGDKAVHKELGNKMERAATTASSLEAEQDCDAQTRFEAASKQSNDPPLSTVNTLGSGEDKKSEGSEGFHQIIDFLTTSHIQNALTECLTLYASPIEQFWQTAALSTNEDGVRGITATIDRKVNVFVSKACIRRHLKLEDFKGLKTLPTIEIFEQLALIGYVITSDSLTFQKGHFSPQWKFFIHTILHCLSPKKTVWEQFSSNIATAIICLATKHTFNFSNFIFMAHGKELRYVHSLGRDKDSLSLNELTDLYTSLSKKKLEQIIKISQARRRAKVVNSNAEEDEEDPSKQGRSLIEELDLDAGISLVPPNAADQGRIDDTQISDQPEEQLGVFSAATALADAARRRQSVENVQTYTRRRREVSTSSGGVSTASRLVSTADISTASELDSTAGVKEKDKGKAIMHESEPPKKIKKRVQVQMSVDEELAKKVFEEEQARFNAEHEARFKAEQEQERIDFETALELQKRTYLKNQGGYKMSHFKGMSYEDIRPIFERVWDQNQAFIHMGSEIEKEVMKRSGFDLQQEFVKKDEASCFVLKQPTIGSRKKSFARKRARETLSEESAKKQKLEDDTEKEELQVYLNIVPEEESLNIESLATKQDVMELYILVKERFSAASPKGYDLLLWGDLKTMIEPNEKDEIWRNQQDWNLIN
ncbi:hypothetical protein Tco_0638512 [Tanacetum coccineum]